MKGLLKVSVQGARDGKTADIAITENPKRHGQDPHVECNVYQRDQSIAQETIRPVWEYLTFC